MRGFVRGSAGKVAVVETRFTATTVALMATVLLAFALAAMALLDAPWLGFVAMSLLFVGLIAREVSVWGVRGFLLVSAAIAGVIAVAFVAQRVS